MRKRRRSKSRPHKLFLSVVGSFLIMVALAAACRRDDEAKSPIGRAPRKSVETAQGPGATVAPASASTPAAAPTSASPSPPVIERAPCLYGCPISLRNVGGRLLEREGWVLFNNPSTKLADFAVYRVSVSTIGRSKTRDWKADPDLPPDETLEPEDFQGANAALHFDRGHQVPLASFSGTRNSEPLNYMSNVTPQRSVLNQKLWNHLEQAERQFVLEQKVALSVVTGPLYEREMSLLPAADEKHSVPSGYFKVIAFVKGDNIETAAVIAEQETSPLASYCEHRVTIDEVERRAGLDIFPLLSDSRERELESQAGSFFDELGCEEQP